MAAGGGSVQASDHGPSNTISSARGQAYLLSETNVYSAAATCTKGVSKRSVKPANTTARIARVLFIALCLLEL